MSTVVKRFADLTITRDPEAAHIICEMQCTTCNEASPASDEPDDPQLWAIEHAAKLQPDGGRHTGFRGIFTNHWRVSIADPRAPLEPMATESG